MENTIDNITFNKVNSLSGILYKLNEMTENKVEFQTFGKYPAASYGSTINILNLSGDSINSVDDLKQLSSELYDYIAAKAASGEHIKVNILNIHQALERFERA